MCQNCQDEVFHPESEVGPGEDWEDDWNNPASRWHY
jgi:hypothetical protein